MQQLRSTLFLILQFSPRKQRKTDPKLRWDHQCYHVPQVVGQPVDQGADPADELQVLGLGGTLSDEVDEEAGWDDGHGEDDADRHCRVHRCAQPGQVRGGRRGG